MNSSLSILYHLFWVELLTKMDIKGTKISIIFLSKKFVKVPFKNTLLNVNNSSSKIRYPHTHEVIKQCGCVFLIPGLGI